jgi:hypothetical protein
MTVMPDLLDFAARAVRNNDPDTSREAALARLGGKATDRRAALIEIGNVGPRGLTDFELARLINRQQTSAGKRRGELRDLGLVEDSGDRRPAPSGSSAIVWRISQKGKDIIQRLNDAGQTYDTSRVGGRGEAPPGRDQANPERQRG